MSASISIQAAADFLRDHDGYLILTHLRPDGDTVGCAAGLCRALRQLGKTAYILPNHQASSLFTPYFQGLLAGCFPTTPWNISPGWTWPSITTPPRSFSPPVPVWTQGGPPAAS